MSRHTVQNEPNAYACMQAGRQAISEHSAWANFIPNSKFIRPICVCTFKWNKSMAHCSVYVLIILSLGTINASVVVFCVSCGFANWISVLLESINAKTLHIAKGTMVRFVWISMFFHANHLNSSKWLDIELRSRQYSQSISRNNYCCSPAYCSTPYWFFNKFSTCTNSIYLSCKREFSI